MSIVDHVIGHIAQSSNPLILSQEFVLEILVTLDQSLNLLNSILKQNRKK